MGSPDSEAALFAMRAAPTNNRLRMVTASFLVKDLGIDWRRGERYFAGKLLDYDLAANNGGWQWSASRAATRSHGSASSIPQCNPGVSTRPSSKIQKLVACVVP